MCGVNVDTKIGIDKINVFSGIFIKLQTRDPKFTSLTPKHFEAGDLLLFCEQLYVGIRAR